MYQHIQHCNTNTNYFRYNVFSVSLCYLNRMVKSYFLCLSFFNDHPGSLNQHLADIKYLGKTQFGELKIFTSIFLGLPRMCVRADDQYWSFAKDSITRLRAPCSIQKRKPVGGINQFAKKKCEILKEMVAIGIWSIETNTRYFLFCDIATRFQQDPR